MMFRKTTGNMEMQSSGCRKAAPQAIHLLITAALVFASASAIAQSAPAQPPTSAQTAPTQPAAQKPYILPPVVVSEVNLIFVVNDQHGRFINDLKQEDLALLDDGKPPLRVNHFTHETNLPLRIGLMIDTSSSIRSRFAFEQTAAKEFMLSVLNTQRDKAFVEGFDIQIELSQKFTSSPADLDTAISKLRPGGGTALYDSLYRTCRDQMLSLENSNDIRKAIVLLSDGDDNYSRARIDDAIKECQRADTIVYTISTNVSPSKDKGDDVLKHIADETGGRVFFPQQIEDIAAHFADIKAELSSQYSLEYAPADFKPDGSYRSIYLKDTGHRGYNVRVHKGYFAKQQ
jgi:VWFA-related protein